jgi:hypothetical protein
MRAIRPDIDGRLYNKIISPLLSLVRRRRITPETTHLLVCCPTHYNELKFHPNQRLLFSELLMLLLEILIF